MRLRNPCLFRRFLLLGWKVRFTMLPQRSGVSGDKLVNVAVRDISVNYFKSRQSHEFGEEAGAQPLTLEPEELDDRIGYA